MKSKTGSFPYMVTNNTGSIKTIEANKLLDLKKIKIKKAVVQSFDIGVQHNENITFSMFF